MGLNITTFIPGKGGTCLFKALGHPWVEEARQEIRAKWQQMDAIHVYDPFGYIVDFIEILQLSSADVAAVYIQAIDKLDQPAIDGIQPKLITEIADTDITDLWVLSFDEKKALSHIGHFLPHHCEIHSLDTLRIPQEMLTTPWQYDNPLNFATNFAFMREGDGHHTRLTTFNFWQRYGAKNIHLWCKLFDHDGTELATWDQPVAPQAETIVIDSAELKQRFGLGDFCGQLFCHFSGVVGHDIIKYALDTYGDEDTVLSATHDANAWPCDYFGGLPAPEAGEQVIVWLQNSHPVTIPPGTITMHVMGQEEATTVSLDAEIKPFASYAWDVGIALPEVAWPQQLELVAGKYFVRPRYEVVRESGQRRCMAHINVERVDCTPDPVLAAQKDVLGKGFILPAPLFSTATHDCWLLPTPMARSQQHLPIQVVVYSAEGKELARHHCGNLARDHAHCVNVSELAAGYEELSQPGQFGHVEMVYDFEQGQDADGWLHGLFRYRDKRTQHQAETSFGSHLFNHPITYKGEPQSYAGPPPGVTTRLFLRLGTALNCDTYCHLIYPVCERWHEQSHTQLQVFSAQGELLAEKIIHIPQSGSLGWYFSELVTEFPAAKDGAYVIIDDRTCRLFGYHGLMHNNSAFSLDHMFGA